MRILSCSFCGKKEEEDHEVFITGKTGCICATCAQQVAIVSKKEEMLSRRNRNEHTVIDWSRFKPHKLKAYLDEFVIGQEEAKKVLSVAIYNHYKRLFLPTLPSSLAAQKTDKEEVEIDKSNIVMVGETGVGKTYLIKTVAGRLNVPFCIADATALTQAGYVGEDVENILVRLLHNADYDITAAERGIVYLDEFDKIARKGENMSITRDVGGEGVQQSLLKMIEGSQVSISPEGGRKHPEQRLVTINTQNILFICGGAFEGIHSIIKTRLKAKPIGFQVKHTKGAHNMKDEELIRYVSAQDLRSYGIIPELVGRLPVVVHLHPLNRVMLKKILTSPRNALIKQYQKLFAMEGTTLDFTEDAIDFIVDKVLVQKLGARTLRNVLEKTLVDPMFDLPTQKNLQKLTIDKQYIMDKLDYITPRIPLARNNQSKSISQIGT